jgi:actin-like ATPase involved in cell morphogenesis
LLKQKSQKEVLKSKPSTASSDKEKLAAGISTIGMQAKRLSGAQRKNLVRERKMKEGSWMVEKPKRKTPPS